MKHLKKLIKASFMSGLLLCIGNTQAQTPYRTAVGLRAGLTSGLTFKQQISSNNQLEAIIGSRPYSNSVTLLVERTNALSPNNLYIYYGVGGHVAGYHSRYYYVWREGPKRYYYGYAGQTAIGFDGIVGIEYKIPKAPIALSVDVKPFIESTSNGTLISSVDPSMGIKITF